MDTNVIYLTLPAQNRKLTFVYEFEGKMTHDDPASYVGAERIRRENAIIRQLPQTNYAKSIIQDRFVQELTYKSQATFFLQDHLNKHENAEVLAILPMTKVR